MKTQLAALSIATLFAAGAAVADSSSMNSSSNVSEGSATSDRHTNQAISNDPFSIQPEGGVTTNDDTGHDRNSRKKLSQGRNQRPNMNKKQQAGQVPDSAKDQSRDSSWDMPGTSGDTKTDSDMDYVNP